MQVLREERGGENKSGEGMGGGENMHGIGPGGGGISGESEEKASAVS